MRARTGASIVAISRDQGVVSNPGSAEILTPGDRVAVVGNRPEIEQAARLLSNSTDASTLQSIRD
jgi:CPA2 family monovalent cation:H+ antiporter-2